MSNFNDFTKHIKDYTDNRKICILGFGREGKSTLRILTEYCNPKEIAIADLNPLDRNNISDDVNIITGKNYQDCLDDYDIVFKSPGIALEKSPEELKCLISSQTQVFFEVFRDQIIGITGTKGKSTVSSLIYHILKESGQDAYLAGNIGIPVFEIAENIKDKSIIVCELSCHQLEYMTVSPEKAIFLNLYEEHLDRYKTMERYHNAKKNIYLHQKEHDALLISPDIAPDRGYTYYLYTISDSDSKADIYVHDGIISHSDELDEYTIPTDKIKLLGKHNHYNIAAAYWATGFYIYKNEFEKALCTFNPLAHRLEYFDTINGIRWYDDSISTACETAIEAVKSLPDIGTVLIGGMDRGIDYQPLVDFLKDTDINIICMETSGKRVFDMLPELERISYVPHLEDAVKLANEITPKGKSCVLSPAAASYGIFKNFEERGDRFKELVKNL